MNNIYVIYGIDNKMIELEVNKIIKKIGINEYNIIKFSMLESNLDDVIEEASTISLFGGNKLIVVNDSLFLTGSKEVNMDTSELEKYLNNYNKNCYIIFCVNNEKLDSRKKIVKLITSIGKVIEINSENNRNYLIKYIKDYLEDYKMDNDLISYFLNKVGNNIDNICSELDKLKVYRIYDKVIIKGDIDNLVLENYEEEVYKLSDYVLNDNKKMALKLYRSLLEKGYDDLAIVSLLGNYFTLLFQIKRLYNKGNSSEDIAGILKINSYRTKLLINSLSNYLESDLELILNNLYYIDNNIKSGLIDKNLVLELFLMNKYNIINVEY